MNNETIGKLDYDMGREEIRYIQTSDKDFWFSLDRHLPETEFAKKVRDRQGYDMVLTSTQVDEQAQHFYRKLGYKDCGGFVVDIEGQEQPMELFLIKSID